MVRQTFSRGRSKVVVVEKVKRRGPGAGETKPVSPAASPWPLLSPPRVSLGRRKRRSRLRLAGGTKPRCAR